MNKLNFSVIWKIYLLIFTNATNKFWSLVMTSLADVDGFKNFHPSVRVARLPIPDIPLLTEIVIQMPFICHNIKTYLHIWFTETSNYLQWLIMWLLMIFFKILNLLIISWWWWWHGILVIPIYFKTHISPDTPYINLTNLSSHLLEKKTVTFFVLVNHWLLT